MLINRWVLICLKSGCSWGCGISVTVGMVVTQVHAKGWTRIIPEMLPGFFKIVIEYMCCTTDSWSPFKRFLLFLVVKYEP